jgi:hypothetical protein
VLDSPSLTSLGRPLSLGFAQIGALESRIVSETQVPPARLLVDGPSPSINESALVGLLVARGQFALRVDLEYNVSVLERFWWVGMLERIPSLVGAGRIGHTADVILNCVSTVYV